MESLDALQTVLLVLQVLVALGLIVFILIQHGKGADAGAAFGSGASNTVFGAQGSGNFMTKTTTILAFVFLANSLALAYIARERITQGQSLMETESVMMEVQEQEQSLEVPQSVEDIPVITESDVPALPEE